MPGQRELLEPHKGDKRYARRDEKGRMTSDQVGVGKSLAADRRTKAKTVAPKGQGDRGDQQTRRSSLATSRARGSNLLLASTPSQGNPHGKSCDQSCTRCPKSRWCRKASAARSSASFPALITGKKWALRTRPTANAPYDVLDRIQHTVSGGVAHIRIYFSVVCRWMVQNINKTCLSGARDRPSRKVRGGLAVAVCLQATVMG